MSENLKGKKVALIGGAGFIGHNLALALKAKGANVEIVDSLQVNNLLAFSSNNPQIQNRELYLHMINRRLRMMQEADIPLHVQDARDYHALSRILNHIAPQVVIQLAAVSHAGRSNKDPFSTFDHSLRTLENALDCTREQVEQFIYFSSSLVYGNFLSNEVDEDHPLNPLGIYGALKLSGEKIVIAYQQVFNLPYTIIRPSALYGPGCVSRRVGQVFIESALKGEPLKVDGDGSERLDFTYIDDLAEGVALTIGNPAAYNQIFNLTFGSSRSILDLAKIIRKHFPVDLEFVTRDNLMPFRGTLNVDKARTLLGYSPQFPIDKGFPRYISWYTDLYSEAGFPVSKLTG